VGHDFLLARNKIVFVNEKMVNLFAFAVVIAETNDTINYKSNVIFFIFLFGKKDFAIPILAEAAGTTSW
jgi:hypothetical protein